MNRTITYRLTIVLVLAIMFLVDRGAIEAATPIDTPALADAGQGLMTTITAISERDRNGKHDLIIQGDGQIPRHSAWFHASPPKIIVDIHHVVTPFNSIVKPVSFPGAKSIRVGYHPTSIRVVIDLAGSDNPMFRTAAQGNALVITLNTETVHESHSIEPDSTSDLPNSGVHPESDPEEDKAAPQKKPLLYDAEEHLTRFKGRDVPPAYKDGVAAYRAGNWSATFKKLSSFLEAFPDNPYAEKACFLTAKAFDRLRAGEVDSHYTQVKQRYEDAIYRYPESVFVSDAYYSIANLSFRAGMVSQSLGYCNLVVNLKKQDHATLLATMLKARLLSSAGKKEDALSIYLTVQRQYPYLPEGIRAKIETAEILFEMNRFRQSLDILKTLARNPENVTQHPQLSRVLGNNYYQLGDFVRAREHLFRYYNTAPEAQDGHLVLARIADAFREDGKAGAASKVYRLVTERYPDTEGAMISMYRMAEQQERGEVKNDQIPAVGITAMGGGMGMPREIYEDVVQTALAKNETTPLVQYALLKLSILDIKEKQYGRSLDRLKKMMKQYPETRLKSEINQAYEEALLHVLEADYRVKKYKRIVNTYQSEKKNMARFTSPELFLTIARAASHLKLDDLAGEMFKTADPYLPDWEKPADMLFHLSGDLVENGKYRAALVYTDLLIDNYPEGQHLIDAYLLKGSILSRLGNQTGAAGMFSAALDNTNDACDRPAILIQKVKALTASGLSREAYQTLLEADDVLPACERVDQAILAEVGELYLQAGHPEKALEVIQNIHKADSQNAKEPRLQLVIARCYERLNSRDLYVSIYSEVAGQDDRFYGKVAQEKMDEINFNAVMQKEM